MIEVITIDYLPPTLNEIIKEARTHYQKSASQKRENTNNVALIAHGRHQFPGEVWVRFDWYLVNFQRDPDNVSAAAKFILDGLTQAGVIQNDSLKIIQSPYIHTFTKASKAEKDKVVVAIADAVDKRKLGENLF